MAVHVVGVRHHSPVCAGLVQRVLEAVQPRWVLVEGPSDMNGRLGELALDHTAGNATTSDIVAFLGWSTVAVGLGLSVASAFLVPLGLLFQHLL